MAIKNSKIPTKKKKSKKFAVVTGKTKLTNLPSYLQNPIWKQYHGLNFYIFSQSTMKQLGEHGYKKALTYIGKRIRIKL